MEPVKLIDEHSAAAQEHPLIKSFIDLVEETVGDGDMEFKDLTTRAFVNFWPHFVIYKHEEDKKDFRVIMFGGHAVKMYGVDMTGKLMSEAGLGDAFDDFYNLNMRIIDGKHRVFASGNHFWQEDDYREWHQVKMPLFRDGISNEVLMFIDTPSA